MEVNRWVAYMIQSYGGFEVVYRRATYITGPSKLDQNVCFVLDKIK